MFFGKYEDLILRIFSVVFLIDSILIFVFSLKEGFDEYDKFRSIVKSTGKALGKIFGALLGFAIISGVMGSIISHSIAQLIMMHIFILFSILFVYFSFDMSFRIRNILSNKQISLHLLLLKKLKYEKSHGPLVKSIFEAKKMIKEFTNGSFFSYTDTYYTLILHKREMLVVVLHGTLMGRKVSNGGITTIFPDWGLEKLPISAERYLSCIKTKEGYLFFEKDIRNEIN